MDNWKYVLGTVIVGCIVGIFGVLTSDPVFVQGMQDFSKNFNIELNPVEQGQKKNDSTAGRVEGPFKVAEVIDGDTILLETGVRVRFLYVDTPETVKPNTPVQCYGPEASNYTKQMLLGKLVSLVSDKDPKDQYGRDLRIVYLEGRNTNDFKQSYNAELVKQGLAKGSFYSPNYMYKDQVESLEKEAKTQLIGRWGACKESNK